jgi:hypothetical protein
MAGDTEGHAPPVETAVAKRRTGVHCRGTAVMASLERPVEKREGRGVHAA